jgi:hypothetical protein
MFAQPAPLTFELIYPFELHPHKKHDETLILVNIRMSRFTAAG